MLTIDLLGTFTVARDGVQITDFHSQTVRALLAYLAVEADRPHERGHLVELLWPDLPHQQGLTQLRQALHRLGQALGAAGSPELLITRQSVQLDPRAVSVDVQRLRALIQAVSAHRHRAVVACPTCLPQLSAALQLWHGDLLVGFYGSGARPFEDWLSRTRQGLQQQIVTAFATLAEHALLRDDRPQAIALLQRWLDLEPWREEAHERLILALALDGQRSAALIQFERCRRALQSHLGIEPSVALLALARQIRSGTPEDPRPLRQIPVPAIPIIGRETERATLARLLNETDYRLITVVGPGGIGKTRLAQAAAAETIFRDGVRFISLAQVTTAEHALAIIGGKFGLPTTGSAQLGSLLAGFLARRDVLLVLDDVDQLAEPPRWLLDLLHGAPALRVLVTARSPLGLSEEHVLLLDGLHVTQQNGALAPAAALFLAAAGQSGVTNLDSTQHAAIAAICRALDGQPLAIIMAAAQTAYQSPAAIAAALAAGLDVLTFDAADRPLRHRSVRASFNWSWQLLQPAERETLARVTIFHGEFSAPMALAVTDADAATLETLARRSLLLISAAGRYRFHTITHRLAAEHLRDQAALAARHARYVTAMLQTLSAAINGGAVQAAAARFLAERREIEAVIQRADARTLAALLDRADGLADLYIFCNRYSEGRATFERAVERLVEAGAQEPAAAAELRQALAAALVGLARMHYICGNYAATLAAAEQVVALAGDADPGNAAAAATAAGWALWQQGEQPRAAARFQAAIAATADPQVPERVAHHAQHGLGMVRWSQGMLPEARAAYTAALAGYRAAGDRWRESDVLMNGGLAALHVGEYPLAADLIGQALTICRAIGHRRGEGHSLGSLGYVQLHLGNYREAHEAFAKCLGVRQETNDIQGQSVALAGLGVLHVRVGADELAEQLLSQAQELARAVGHRWAAAVALGFQSVVAWRSGRLHEAALLLEMATRLAQQSGDANAQAYVQLFWGHLRRIQGDPAAAAAAYDRVIQARHAAGQTHLTAEPLAGHVALALDAGRAQDALQHVTAILEIAARTDLAGAEDRHQIDLVCLQALRAANDPRAAAWTGTAQRRLEQALTTLEPPERQQYLRLPAVQHLAMLLSAAEATT